MRAAARRTGARRSRGRRTLSGGMLGLLLASVAVVAVSVTAGAHTPHDDIFDVAVSPTYVTDTTVYVISRGILLKSTNGGQAWTRLVRGIDNKADLTALEMSTRTRRLLFVSSPRDGIYRSTDAGASWSRVDRGLPTGQIAMLAMSPHSDEVVYATGAKGGLFRTADRGDNWDAVAGFDTLVTAIVFAPDVRDAMLVADDGGTLHRTRDGGATWERERIAGAGRIRAIGVSPTYSVDETVFLGTDARGTPRCGRRR